MSPNDFLQLPPAVKIGVVVMLWPAIWASALGIAAFAGDVIRQTKKQTSPAMTASSTTELR
jgi:hypothetical protein